MTLESQIQQFINTAKLGDNMLLSKDGDLELGTGLILQRFCNAFDLFHVGTLLESWGLRVRADLVLQRALLWSYRTGRELADPDPEATIRDQLMERCCPGMSEHDARSLIRDLLGDLATWLDQRHSGSSQTAELLRAIFP